MRATSVVFALYLAAGILLPPEVSQSASVHALPSPQTSGAIYCASDDGRRNYCQADVRGGVQLTRQRSDSPCVFNQTWGYGERGIWVDRGCRAEFSIGNGGYPEPGGPGYGPPGQTGSIYCASNDGRRNYCQADVRGGVQLTRQRSGSPCIFGQTWGYENRGIWVDRGCRAEFAVGYTGGPGNGGPGWGGWGQAYNVYCASDDMHRNWCPVDTRGGVRLVRKRSDAACVWDSTWGYDRKGVWVDRGCRADFEIGQAGWRPDQKQTVYCASDDMRRNFCSVNTSGDVRLIRQRSDADCIFNRTWGFEGDRIWVDRGCRADFLVGGRY